MLVMGGFADEEEKVGHYVPGAHKALTLGGVPAPREQRPYPSFFGSVI